MVVEHIHICRTTEKVLYRFLSLQSFFQSEKKKEKRKNSFQVRITLDITISRDQPRDL
jgi:hypothetical protein